MFSNIIQVNNDGRIVINMAFRSLYYIHCCVVNIFLWPSLLELYVEVVTLYWIRVEGYSLNYLVMNISGYIFYGIYSTLGYFFSFKGAGTVVIADLIFVYHALLMCLVLSVQALIYPLGKNRVSKLTIMFLIGLWIFNLVLIFFTEVKNSIFSF